MGPLLLLTPLCAFASPLTASRPAHATPVSAFHRIGRPRARALASKTRVRVEPPTIFQSDYPEVVDEDKMLAKSEFPIPPNRLVEMAKKVYNDSLFNAPDEAFADDFVFMGPVVGPLKKEPFLNAIRGFDVLTGFPDLTGRYYHFRVDPFEPDRVWTTSRAIGTNTGTMAGLYPPSGKVVESPPQTISLKFNEKGQIRQVTVGYVMDRAIGNTGGLGGIFGLLYGIGKPLPFPEAQPWKMSRKYRFFNWIGGIQQRRKARRAAKEAEKAAAKS
ncbi:hypothetical protein AAMO2058_000365600 [Amorphochlora amoebiformis]